MPRDLPTRFSSAGGKAGSFKWDSTGLDRTEFRQLDDATRANCKARLRELARSMRAYAQALSETKWKSHPERHPSPHWPSSRTATQGIYSAIRGKFIMRIELGHGPGTIWQATTIAHRYNYGYKLEATRPVVGPTLDVFQERFTSILADAMTMHLTSVPDEVFGDDGGGGGALG